MGLTAEIELTRRHAGGEFRLSVALAVPAGGVLAILGPNGAGKSTVLGCLAGLLAPDRAEIALGGRVLDGPGVRLPPEARGVGLLAQDPLLFPHLSVLDNVAFGPRSRGAGRAAASAVARRWLAEVDAAAFADRRPAQLSGGQAQRVAIARALAGDPGLLLLDEPLAALDAHTAPAVRGLLRRVLRPSPGRAAPAPPVVVLVTHDPLDALALADEVLVLNAGKVVERGPTREVLAAPRTPFTARVAGLNLVPGTAVAEGLRTGRGELVRGLLAEDAVLGEPAVAVFAPAAVAVYPPDPVPAGSPRNTAPAVVGALEPQGSLVRLHCAGTTERAGTEERVDGAEWTAGLTADLTSAAVAELALEPGRQIRLAIKATMVTVHPAPAEDTRPADGDG
ncbi:molybdate transport system ATP-binding protein [Amycolatopsis arida]|uniref:Molybdate transport system ATP-binding protein n=1 Tax=Amycolatopsis arida TaxID=587909 RepID=A0A1I5QMU7_9PSEU|nr:ATP-binding cassette domain-containing protein [Amycolatopsis arida]TDX98901.1 molybdate transport system ATP-binding protein [Amycolatopsis arida]SFP47583.1 molybdate transport system ATP-binding protein [Amycolatopsis arida]